MRTVRAAAVPYLVVATVALTACQGSGASTSRDPGTAVLESSSSSPATPSSTTPSASTESSGSSGSSGSAAAKPAARGRGLALWFGDSDFVGGGCTPDRTQDMAQIAGDRLGYRSIIRGAGGTGYASANPEFGLSSFLKQIHEGALDVKGTPSLVVIEGGANDIGRSIDKVTRNAERVLSIARAKHPDALLAMMGPIDVRGDYTDTDPIVGALEFAASQQGVPFIDAEHWITHDDTSLLCSDYDHPTLKGHRLVGRKLARALRRLGA